MIWVCRQIERRSSSHILTTGEAACCSDPAKITPHYPNETLAWAAPALTHHRLPHKASTVLFCARESTEGEDIVAAARFLFGEKR